jgi:hypothetical protein
MLMYHHLFELKKKQEVKMLVWAGVFCCISLPLFLIFQLLRPTISKVQFFFCDDLPMNCKAV